MSVYCKVLFVVVRRDEGRVFLMSSTVTCTDIEVQICCGLGARSLALGIRGPGSGKLSPIPFLGLGSVS